MKPDNHTMHKAALLPMRRALYDFDPVTVKARLTDVFHPSAKVHLASALETAGAFFIWTSDQQAPGRGWVVYYTEGACTTETVQYNAYVRAVRSITGK